MKKPILLIALIIIAVTALSCGGGKGGGASPDVTTSVPDADDAEVTTADPDLPSAEPKKYNGSRFSVIYPTHQNYSYQSAETETGDALNDALITRDRTVSELLDIAIEYKVTENIDVVYPIVSESVLAGDHTYDLVLSHCVYNIAGYITDGIVLNWYDIDSVDFAKPYWNNGMNDSLAINGVLPTASGNYIMSNPLMLFFNTLLTEAAGCGNLYELTSSGGWTWDKLAGFSKNAVTDLNGDGVLDINDQYGFAVLTAGSSYRLRSIPQSCDMTIYERDDSGQLFCNANSPRMQTILEKIVKLFSKGEGGYCVADAAYKTGGDIYFGEGKALFWLVDSLIVGAYRDVEFEYGILPLPKFDENQENYTSLDWGGLMLIPITVKDREYVGTVTEWLCYYGSKLVLPEYYNTMMDVKVARDSESADMLDLVFDNLVYEPAVNLRSPGFYSMFDGLVMKGDSNLASYCDSRLSAENAYIDKMNAAYAALASK